MSRLWVISHPFFPFCSPELPRICLLPGDPVLLTAGKGLGPRAGMAGAHPLAAACSQARRILPHNWISLDATGACDFNPLSYHMAAGWIEI